MFQTTLFEFGMHQADAAGGRRRLVNWNQIPDLPGNLGVVGRKLHRQSITIRNAARYYGVKAMAAMERATTSAKHGKLESFHLARMTGILEQWTETMDR